LQVVDDAPHVTSTSILVRFDALSSMFCPTDWPVVERQPAARTARMTKNTARLFQRVRVMGVYLRKNSSR
jgi:hypothetical protein